MGNCNFQRDLNELFSPQQSAPPRLAAESTQLARLQILDECFHGNAQAGEYRAAARPAPDSRALAQLIELVAFPVGQRYRVNVLELVIFIGGDDEIASDAFH